MNLNGENTANKRLLGYSNISKLLSVMDSHTNKIIEESKKEIFKTKGGDKQWRNFIKE